jgi:Zn-dependent protease with chaperone function
MRFSVRAVAAVAMLVGFYVLVVGLAVGLVVGEALLLVNQPLSGLYLGIFAVPAFFALLGALITIERAEQDDVLGDLVTEQDQPRLWALVNRIAAEVGTRPPDEVRIISVVNAMVSEKTRMLGLRVVKRRLYIGAPLLACFTERQLVSVLAHELGHYGNRDTRLAGIVMSGRNAQVRLLKGLKADNWVKAAVVVVLAEYTKLCLKVSSAIGRRQELAADAVAARITGSATAVSMLRELSVLDAAWDVFVERHLDTGVAVGYLPNDVFDGFAELLRCAELADFLDEVRWDSEPEHGPYDSHPPTPERIAHIEALAAEPAPGWGDGPATGLLVDPARVMEASFPSAVVAEAVRVGWADFGHLAVRAETLLAAERLLEAAAKTMERPATLATVLDALDAGKLAELAPSGIKPGCAVAGTRVRREYARGFVGEDLTGLVSLAQVDIGLARWTRDWIGDVEYVGTPPFPEHVDAAVADGGGTSALRAALTTAGIALDYRPVAQDRRTR